MSTGPLEDCKDKILGLLATLKMIKIYNFALKFEKNHEELSKKTLEVAKIKKFRNFNQIFEKVHRNSSTK